jgi:FKBP-type peptidyl-prolyl cis-trans isomerase FkpA
MKRFGIFLGAALGFAACNNDITGLEPPSDPATETFAPSLGVNISQMSKTKEGVYYQEVTPGTGLTVTDTTSTVNVTYAGFLKDGKLFDSGTNVVFDLDLVVAGFRSGVLGMKEGGKRKIVIPSELGYGRAVQKNLQTGEIIVPRQSTLIYDLEVVKVTNPIPPSS